MNNWKSTDGYLLFDFSDVNPALTNQIVDGIYERAKNLIANNKFVLLVNEGVHTPIPAVVAYVNQAYVIETVLYAYTITSNDNVKKTNHEYGAATLEDMTDVSLLNPTDGQYLGYDAETNYWVNKSIAPIPTKTSQLTNDSGFITDADVPVIDDTTTSATKVWSSDKVSSELSGKADSSSVPTKTSQLTNDSGFLTDADVPVIDDTAVVNNKVWSSYKTNSELIGKADSSAIPTKTSELDNDSGFITSSDIPAIPDELNELSDVSLTTPASGNSLVFDGSKWANDTLAAADIPYSQGVSVADKIDDVESTILTVHSKNVSITFDNSGEGAVTDTDIDHIITVEDMMSDSGVYPAYFAYKVRGNNWRIKTLNRSNLNFTSSGLISSTRTVKIYYLA